jgi:multimeric flavodoxin WrbA
MIVNMLGLNFSPRDRSNSAAMLAQGKGYLEEKYKAEVDFRIIHLRDLNILGCLSCNVCGKTKDTGDFIPCVSKDVDDVQKVLDAMLWADGIAVATPVYFGMPSDLFAKFIMRTRVLRHQNFALANRVVGILAVAGRRSGGSETAIMTAWLPFIRNNCIPVGNGNLTGQFGTMAWAGPREHVLTDEWGLEQARATCERIYTLARVVKAGQAALGEKPSMTFCYKSGMR